MDRLQAKVKISTMVANFANRKSRAFLKFGKIDTIVNRIVKDSRAMKELEALDINDIRKVEMYIHNFKEHFSFKKKKQLPWESKAGDRRRSFNKPSEPTRRQKPTSKKSKFPLGGEAEIHKRGDNYYVISRSFGYESIIHSAKKLQAAAAWCKKHGVELTKIVETKASDLIEAMVEDGKSATEVLDEAGIVPTWWNQRWAGVYDNGPHPVDHKYTTEELERNKS